MDISKIDAELASSRRSTLASDFDFDLLEKINTDSNGLPISEDVSRYLDLSRAFLSRMPRDWESYLSQKPADISNFIQEIRLTLDIIANLEGTSPGSRGRRLERVGKSVKEITSQQLTSWSQLTLLQAVGQDRTYDVRGNIDRLQSLHKELELMVSESSENAQSLSEMADAAQESISKIVASGRARIFHTDSLNYERAANKWLAVTLFLGSALIFLSFAFAFGWILKIPSGGSSGDVASALFSKFLILATVGATVTFAAKQYGANRHNAVQNLHRSSALRTYRALLAASRDEAVQDAILQQAATAIFAPGDTAYTKSAAQAEYAPLVQLQNGMLRSEAAKASPS